MKLYKNNQILYVNIHKNSAFHYATKYGMHLKQDVTNEIMLRKINDGSQEETIKAVCSHFHKLGTIKFA